MVVEAGCAAVVAGEVEGAVRQEAGVVGWHAATLGTAGVRTAARDGRPGDGERDPSLWTARRPLVERCPPTVDPPRDRSSGTPSRL
jgi:hypothetical protein